MESTGLNWPLFPEFHNLQSGSGNNLEMIFDFSCLETVFVQKYHELSIFIKGTLKSRKTSDMYLF